MRAEALLRGLPRDAHEVLSSGDHQGASSARLEEARGGNMGMPAGGSQRQRRGEGLRGGNSDLGPTTVRDAGGESESFICEGQGGGGLLDTVCPG